MNSTARAKITTLFAVALVACEHVAPPAPAGLAGKGDGVGEPSAATALDPARIAADIAALSGLPSRHALRWDRQWLARWVPGATADAALAQLAHEVFGGTRDPLAELGDRLRAIAAGGPRARVWEHRFGFRNVVGYGPAFDANDDPTARSPATNLVLELAGDSLAAGALIVGAHYDTIAAPPLTWTRDLVRDVAVAQPGADDNASGVAAVLELARVIAARREQEDREGRSPAQRPTIYFVLFGVEELGRQGSYVFSRLCPGGDRSGLVASVVAEQPDEALGAFCEVRAGRAPFRGMINLDSLGYPFEHGALAADRARLFRAPGHAASVALADRVIEAVEQSAADFTLLDMRTADRHNKYGDHLSFSELELAAVRIMASGENPNHHSSLDTFENLDPAYVGRIAGVVLEVLAALAGGA